MFQGAAGQLPEGVYAKKNVIVENPNRERSVYARKEKMELA